MNNDTNIINRRILVVDDSQTIQSDFKSILMPAPDRADLAAAEDELFGTTTTPVLHVSYELETADQGEEAVEKVAASVKEGRPFALAFVDVRMPPGMDGVDTVEQLFKIDPRVHAVLCTAYSNHSWSSVIQRIGQSDRLLILKKPFDPIEVKQLALALTAKWQLQLACDRKRDEVQQWMAELNNLMISTKAKLPADRGKFNMPSMAGA